MKLCWKGSIVFTTCSNRITNTALNNQGASITAEKIWKAKFSLLIWHGARVKKNVTGKSVKLYCLTIEIFLLKFIFDHFCSYFNIYSQFTLFFCLFVSLLQKMQEQKDLTIFFYNFIQICATSTLLRILYTFKLFV